MERAIKIKFLLLKADWITIKWYFKKKVLPKLKDIILGKEIECSLTATFSRTYLSDEGMVTFGWLRVWTERRRLLLISREVHPFQLHCTSFHPLIDNFILTDKMDPEEAFHDLVKQTASFRDNWAKLMIIGKRLEETFNGRNAESDRSR